MEELGRKLDEALEACNWELAQMLLTQMWLATSISFTQRIDPSLKELTYLKTPIETDDGEYLLLLIHTKGKKLRLQAEDSDGTTSDAPTTD
jgi:hypothetical protein